MSPSVLLLTDNNLFDKNQTEQCKIYACLWDKRVEYHCMINDYTIVSRNI